MKNYYQVDGPVYFCRSIYWLNFSGLYMFIEIYFRRIFLGDRGANFRNISMLPMVERYFNSFKYFLYFCWKFSGMNMFWFSFSDKKYINSFNSWFIFKFLEIFLSQFRHWKLKDYKKVELYIVEFIFYELKF